jgi:hypothetical protein
MKKCGKCQQNKDLDDFCTNKRYKDGKHDTCKSCRADYNKKNKNKIKEYYQNNINYHKEYSEKYRSVPENKEKQKIYSKQYHIDNREKRLQYSRQYDIKNNEAKKLTIKKWFEANPDYLKLYMAKRYNDDIFFKIRSNLRSRLYHVVKKESKIQSTLNLLGCTIEELKFHLESQFLPEITWENHGIIWEIDHIKPCASFDLTNLEQQKECFNYTNLQPLFKTTAIAESFGYKDQTGNRNKNKYEK